MAILLDLPREIVTLICSFLKQAATYNCSFVNKDFNAAATPELWREPVLSSNSGLNKLIKCLKLSKRGEYIRTLTLGLKIALNDDELLQLLPFIPNLEVFDIRKADELSDKSIIPLSYRCQQLKTFSVKGASITYRSMHYLGRHCRYIKRLTLASCPHLTPMAMLPFADKDIESLDLSGCKWLTASDTAYDISCLLSLNHLNLVCCDMINNDFIQRLAKVNTAAATAAATTAIVGGNSNEATVSGFDTCHHYRHQQSNLSLSSLQEFSVTGGSIIDDSALIPFVKTHPHMRDMFLLECAITDATLEAIATHMLGLRHLDLSFCQHITANGIRYLISHCSSLEMLGLKDCGLTQHDFREIPAHAYPSIAADQYAHLNTLNYVELTYIREEYENHLQQNEDIIANDAASVVAGSSSAASAGAAAAAFVAENVEDEESTAVLEEEEEENQADVAEAYRSIQQYLGSFNIS